MYPTEILNSLIYIGVSFFITILLLFISYMFSLKQPKHEKMSAYECGFAPFDDLRRVFDIQFYLVGLLFMLFDLEIAFIFPWVLSLDFQMAWSFWVMVYFIIIITLGFVYEWKKGVLNWSI